MIKIVNSTEFIKELESKLVIVDFFAEWCGPCKMLSPILEEIEEELINKVSIIKVNVDENIDIAKKYNISSIPALIVIKDSEEVSRLIGFSPKQVIKEKIEKFL